jgi:hypothetical protein
MLIPHVPSPSLRPKEQENETPVISKKVLKKNILIIWRFMERTLVGVSEVDGITTVFTFFY